MSDDSTQPAGDGTQPLGEDIDAMLRAAGEAWQIDRPASLWGAFKRSPDGRHWHYIVCDSALGLAQEIIQAEREDQENTP
jgi:hypothetical protein